MTKLFVGGLPYSLTSDELKAIFATVGTVLSATVITDKFSGQSKGFGFVEMEDEDAQKAIQTLNETEQQGRKIFVSVARPREERPQNGGGFGGGRGGDFNRGGGFGGGRDRGGRGR